MKRFPPDFAFQPSSEGEKVLRSQFATTNRITIWNHMRRNIPYLFTENGVAMLSSVLNSDRAIEVNIAIMRIFTKLRSFLMLEKNLSDRMCSLVKKNNATLSFFSEPDKGTTVEIAFRSILLPTPSDVVLLENDPLVQLIWRTTAKAKGIRINIYSDPAEMQRRLTEYSSNTFFYFDLNLNNGVKGVDIARQVSEAGYKNLFMTTGDETFDYSAFSFLKGKVDKKFPL